MAVTARVHGLWMGFSEDATNKAKAMNWIVMSWRPPQAVAKIGTMQPARVYEVARNA